MVFITVVYIFFIVVGSHLIDCGTMTLNYVTQFMPSDWGVGLSIGRSILVYHRPEFCHSLESSLCSSFSEQQLIIEPRCTTTQKDSHIFVFSYYFCIVYCLVLFLCLCSRTPGQVEIIFQSSWAITCTMKGCYVVLKHLNLP